MGDAGHQLGVPVAKPCEACQRGEGGGGDAQGDRYQMVTLATNWVTCVYQARTLSQA